MYRLAGGLEVRDGQGVQSYGLTSGLEVKVAEGGQLEVQQVAQEDGGSDGEGLSLQQLCWLEASLWRLSWLQLDMFGAGLDPEALGEAVEVAESGACP